ncbi:MAG: AI-2E family transporter [Agathobacter sp.]|nr:AI-2E family transporter [Agathobacter sp.]
MKEKISRILEKPWCAYTVAACTAVLLFVGLTHLGALNKFWGYVSPVTWGIIFAYLINPLVNYFERKPLRKMKKEKPRHVISVVLALIVVLVIIALLLVTLIPSIVKSVTGIIENIETYGTVLQGYLEKISALAREYQIDLTNITQAGEEIIGNLVEYVTKNADTIAVTFYSVGISLVNIGMGVVIAIYFLLDKDNIIGGINRIRKLVLKDSTYKNHNEFWDRCHTILSRFLIFDIIDGIIIAMINTICMFVFNMENIVLVSVVVGVTNLFPTFGPIVGGIVGAMILILTSPIDALIFLIFTTLIQLLDASVLKPKLFGGGFGVPAVWIFIAIVVGGKMFGIVGILMAVPVAAIFTYILNEIIIPRLERHKKAMKG